MEELGLAYSASPVHPLPSLKQPMKALAFAWSWRTAMQETITLLRKYDVGVVAATGGFVSGPAIAAATRLRIPRALVNLDAVPGQANRQLARLCDHVFSVYATPVLPHAEHIGLPLRTTSVSGRSKGELREQFGLHAERPTMFITGATHGAESMIRAMMALVRLPGTADAFSSWQVLHQCGTFDAATLQRAYDEASITAIVVPYVDVMGEAYAAAELVLSRAGAGSVAEAWANAVPTIFMPNPYHKDQHQRLNAQPMVDVDGAVLVVDHIEPEKTAKGLAPVLLHLMRETSARERMRRAAEASRPQDGADAVAQWIMGALR